MNKCQRCNHEWESIVVTPKTCVRCKSYYWDEPHKRKVKIVAALAGKTAPMQNKPIIVAKVGPSRVAEPTGNKPKMGFSEEMNAEECIKTLSFVPEEKVAGLVAKLRMECERPEVADYIISTAMENRKTLADQPVPPNMKLEHAGPENVDGTEETVVAEKSDLAKSPENGDKNEM